MLKRTFQMDYSPLISQVMNIWWLLPIVILGALLKSAWFKGKLGEALVKSVVWYRLPKETYTPFHDVTLLTADGTTQIDHVFVSAFGVFVVETKHMKGWIFGSERQANWTQKIFKKTSNSKIRSVRTINTRRRLKNFSKFPKEA